MPDWTAEILSDAKPIPEIKRACLRSRLIDRMHGMIAAEMKKQGIKDAPAIERLAARV